MNLGDGLREKETSPMMIKKVIGRKYDRGLKNLRIMQNSRMNLWKLDLKKAQGVLYDHAK